MSYTDESVTRQTPTSGSAALPRPHDGEGLNLRWWQVIPLGAVAAAVLNLAVLLAARAAGASFAYLDAGVVHQVTSVNVVVSSALPMAVGMALAVLLAQWWFGAYRLAQVVGAGLALLTVAGSVLADTDGATRFALSLMHVVVAAAVVLSLEVIRRRALAGDRR